jgi:hypothetical protein
MRDRPFLTASESPRPYSELRAERDSGDLNELARRRTLDLIATIEAEAEGLTDPSARILKQLEAEELRAALDANRRF